MKRHLLTSKHRRGFGPNGQTASELIIQDSVDRVTQTFLQASVPIDKFHRLVNRDSIVAFRSLGSIPSIRTVRRSIVRVLEEKKDLCAVVVTNLDFRLCLKVKEMDRCDASSLQKLLEETLLEYEIDWQQITNFVTDGARACVSLGRRLNEQYAIQHTLCAAHLLHLISQKLMESFPNINGLCKLVRVFFKRGIQAGRKKRWRSQNITDISLPSKNTLGNLVKMCFRCVHETQKTYLLFITKEETSETANQMIKCLSNEGSIQDLRFIEYFSRLFTPLIDGIQERQLRKDTLNRWRNIETWLFKMSGKDYAKIINLSVNSGTMGKIMDFLNKIRRYKPRWEDANRIIYTHFYLCPEHIKPLIEDENKLCDKMRKYLRGDLIGQFIDFQNFFDEKKMNLVIRLTYTGLEKNKFLEICPNIFLNLLVMEPTSCEVERVFSHVTYIMNPRRNRLNTENLEAEVIFSYNTIN
ncbi:hypothetical protein M0812_02688 [Anaeramoeba flamelloides]|uniref:Transposase n=2 Tax=Anaeramoeba flamelloides TaxID=1746091 RepID=A0AAV7YT30_9EUKA|nr:hypothetical protein M0812_02688 [Anaeramoeba flamelloides]